MANTILHKGRTSDATAPVAGQIALREIVINAVSGIAYIKKTDGTVIPIGSFILNGAQFTGPVGLKSVSETNTAPAPASGVITIDLSLGTVFSPTALASNVTSFSIINAPSGASSFTLILKQDATGGRTVAWTFTGKTLKWPSGSAPTVTPTANKEDIFSFVSKDGGATWYGFTGGQSY